MKAIRIAGLILFLSGVLMSSAAADVEYAGVVERDKGQGVYVLEERDADFPSTPDAWGGAIAEFRRRHPDRKIVAPAPIQFKFSAGFRSITRTQGIVIITDPK